MERRNAEEFGRIAGTRGIIRKIRQANVRIGELARINSA